MESGSIFIYHLDFEIVKLFKLYKSYNIKEIKEIFNLATRIAFLVCDKRIIIPASNYFESNIAFSILNALRTKNVIRRNLVEFVSSSCSLDDLLNKKQKQHGGNIEMAGYHYKEFINQEKYVHIPGTYRMRRESASNDIKNMWATDEYIGRLVDEIYEKVKLKYSYRWVGDKLEKVPDLLGEKAYISNYVTPLLEMDEVDLSVVDRIINIFITRGYIKSFLDEYHAIALTDIPLMSC